jgi:hypothetical protein
MDFEQSNLTVDLAENGFLVSWNEPVLVKTSADSISLAVSAIGEALGRMKKQGGEADDEESDDEDDAGDADDQSEAWKGQPANQAFNPLADAVLKAVGGMDRPKAYRIVRRSLICANPHDVLPALEQADASFKAIMRLRLGGAIENSNGA